MRITSLTIISVDGVVQGNGGPDEDRRGGFERGGWARDDPDSEALEYICQFYERAEAFLFGRWTFELFRSYWGAMPAGSHRIADALNSRPKYVVSNTLTGPSWDGSEVMARNLDAIDALRSRPGGELQVHGSPTVLNWLFQAGMIDELSLLTVPVVVGQGARLFPESGNYLPLELIQDGIFPKGATLRVYRVRR